MFSFFKKKEEKEEKPKNLKLIALCLAFEVANADNDIDVREMDLILQKIKESIDLSVLTEKEIFDVIQEESQKRVSFYDIINDINKSLDKKEKIDVLKMLWEIAYADKVLDVDEEKAFRWKKELVHKEALKYKTRYEFRKGCGSAYSAARINKWLDEVCAHMTPVRRWTKELIHKEALKYKTKNEFREGCGSAYGAATKKKIIALGGISKKNIKLLNLTSSFGFGGISYFK